MVTLSYHNVTYNFKGTGGGMADWKDYILAVGATLLGIIGYFSKAKITEIDGKLKDLDDWKNNIDVTLGEFKQVQKQLDEMKHDQRASLIILNDLRNSLLRVNNEERRQ